MKNISNTIKSNIKQTVINTMWILCYELLKKGRTIATAGVVIITILLSTGFTLPVAATTNSGTAIIGLNVGSTLTLTISPADISLTGSLNTILTATQTLAVTTNSGGGYVLQLQMNHDRTDLLDTRDIAKTCAAYTCVPTVTNHLASTSGALDSGYLNLAVALPNDTWGYSFSTSANVLTTPPTTFFTMPDSTHPQVINTMSVPVEADRTYVTFGAKPTSSFPSGVYRNSIVYTAVTVDLPEPPAPTATEQWVKASTTIAGASASQFTVDLDPNMIPVVNKFSNNIYPSSWCNYDSKRWCNAVTVDPTYLTTAKSLTVGQDIPEDQILGYWVYIPRYAYQVTRYDANNDNTGYQTQAPFNIFFQKKADTKCVPTPYTGSEATGRYDAQGYNSDCNSSGITSRWSTHPAFSVCTKDLATGACTSAVTELNGFWYGKFESSRSDNYYCFNETNDSICNTSSKAERGVPLNGTVNGGVYATIKPNKSPATYQRVSNAYLSAKYIATAHGLSTDTGTHMSTNNHWGAATYLSISTYGVGDEPCADATCSTNFKKVYRNGYYYGSVSTNRLCTVTNATGDTSTTASGCRFVTGAGPQGNHSDGSISQNLLYQYHTTIGQQASTTGNVYGVYDMTGGVYEYQMSVYANPTNTPMSGYESAQNSGFTLNGTTTGYCSGSSTNNYATACTIANPVVFPDTKYYQAYDVSIFTNPFSGGYSHNNQCTYQTCGGQALHETKSVQSVSSYNQSWGSGYSNFVLANSPWFIRGGGANGSSYFDLFFSGRAYGSASFTYGWRAVAGAY
jgi:hypothetical protein